jgi:hypothetical protein
MSVLDLPPRRCALLRVWTLAALLLQGSSAVAQTSNHTNLAGSADFEIVDSLEVVEFTPPVAISKVVAPQPTSEAVFRNRMANGKILSVNRAEPSTLPDLAVIRTENKQSTPLSVMQRQSEAAPKEEKQRFLSLGATVIDRQMSHVTWVDSKGQMAQALCGFDISLLDSLSHFQKGDTHYSMHLTLGLHDSRRDGRFLAADFADVTPMAGEMILPAGKLEAGDETLADLRHLGKLIERNQIRLLRYQKARFTRQEAERRWQKANPKLPKDEQIVFRPHSGSRYLRESVEDKRAEANGKGAGK